MSVSTRRLALLLCLVAGGGLRVARLLQHPFIHADGPGHIALAQSFGGVPWSRALTGYYPPGFAIALRAVHDATGLDWEHAGRAVSLVAGVATIPLAYAVAIRVASPAAALAAAALAALHPYLARASVEVLAESLQGLLVAVWAVLMLGPASAPRTAAAAAVGAAATMVRAEGIALVGLMLLAALSYGTARERVRRGAAAALAAAVVLAPLVLSVHRVTGAWGISGKEGHMVARKYGVAAGSLGGLIVEHPLAFARVYGPNLLAQCGHTLGAAHVALLLPLALGLLAPARTGEARRARWLALATVGVFTLAIAIAPGRRYAVPLVPLLLPWAAIGLERIALRLRDLGLSRRIVAGLGAALAVTLVAGTLKEPPERDAEQCSRAVCRWLDGLYPGGLPPMMARDGRFAYVCRAPFVLEPFAGGRPALLDTMRRRRVGLWLAEVTRHGVEPPPGMTLLGERCGGALRIAVFATPPG